MHQIVLSHTGENCQCVLVWLKKRKLTLLEFIDLPKADLEFTWKKLCRAIDRPAPLLCKKNKFYRWMVDFVKFEIANRLYDN